MKRRITVPAPLPAAALAELKQWLAIGADGEDTALAGLLQTALDMCEAFIRAMPLEAEIQEILTASRPWQTLSTRPVNAIIGVEGIPAEGSLYAQAAGDYEIELNADGSGCVRLLRQGAAGRIAVRFTAGLAPDWGALPESIRHGIIRLAAHYYRERDSDSGAALPDAVAALWQPWRRMEIA